ncbi:MAG: hypothetical protein M3N56_09395 [Actinomycetota bacterium]|nr:hypothetical protein [Actinomycetota bacterium]
MLSVAGVDGAIEALLVRKAPARARAHSDPHVGRDKGGGAPMLGRSLMHPGARSRGLAGRHPVQENAISHRTAEATQPRPHRGHHEAGRVGQPRAKLGHRTLERVDLARERTRADPNPQPRGVELKAGDLVRDLGRRVPVQRQHPHTELDPGGGRGEPRKRVQTASSRLVV